MEKRFNWRLVASASAIALLGGLTSLQAHALGLGRISVQSALGEPLRAEIDIAEMNADEAATLKASVAPAEAFRAAGLEYSAFMSDLQISIQKRPDGRSFLRLSSPRAITEPFVDLILEANWASGRIVRDYTMLFDPPNLRQPNSAAAAAAAAITAPSVTRPVLSAMPATAGPTPAPAAVRPAPVAKAPPTDRGMPAAPKPASAGGKQLAVKPGDTAGKIAALVKPAGVSLDQMLATLLRANPSAFIGGDINRLKSGSVLDIPGSSDKGAGPTGEANTTIVAQSKNFNDFRRKLAEGAPATQTDSANRQAGGKVQAKVEDKAPIAATPDKLTLSKGAVQSKATAEDQIAKDRQAKQATDRVAEVAKNIGDLNKLSGVSTAAGGAVSAASAAKVPGLAVAKPDALPAPVPLPVAPASAAASAPPTAAAVTVPPVADTTSTAGALSPASAPDLAASAPMPTASQAAPAPVASAPLASASATKPAAAAPPPTESSLMGELTSSPFVLPGFAGLLLLLGGFAFYRYRQRKNSAQVDSSFLESRLQPDSFFGASGGQRIDTNEGAATGSSLVYSPSQLDAAGDVDPVAEADVYLAYGRDLQAEEILKEAMRTSPNRVAVYAKLMEIYAKRRDVNAFEVVARDAFNLTHGEGPEWAYIGEMGRELDPTNALYQPDGQSPDVFTAKRTPATAPAGAAALGGGDTTPKTSQASREPASAPVDFDLDLDLDLDLDFSIGDGPVVAAAKPIQTSEPTVALQSAPVRAPVPVPVPVPAFDGFDMDFDIGTIALKPVVNASPVAPAIAPSAKLAATADETAADDALMASGLTFTNEPLTSLTSLTSFTPPKSNAPPPAAVMDHGMLEFDMGSLSLDLDGPATGSPAAVPEVDASAADGPLETKFALAEEFRALGDMDGARSLAEEVLAEAKGSLKNKAQAFVNALS